jgi:hypothetical protein
MSGIGAELPFGNNTDEAAAQVVRDTYAHRQRFIAATATLNGSSSLVADATLVRIKEIKVTPPISTHRPDPPNPPWVAEFLLRLCVTSKYKDAALGDMNERFVLNCAKRGLSRAQLLYCAEAAQSLLPLLGRLLRRFLTWAAVADAIRRHFLG